MYLSSIKRKLFSWNKSYQKLCLKISIILPTQVFKKRFNVPGESLLL